MTTTLHIARIRKTGEPDWFDPQSDIRKVLPIVMAEVTNIMLLEYGGKPEENEVLYIRQCIEIFRIRILEDITHVAEQVSEFFNAISVIRADIRNIWCSGVVAMLMSVYALFCRRDAAVDRREADAIYEYSRLSALKDLLTPATWEKVKAELQAQGSLLVQNRLHDTSCAFCAEDGKMLENIKAIAAQFINGTGDQDWNSKAEACDAQFSTPSVKSMEAKVALALAYPTYKQPTLDVEVTKED